MSKKLLSTALEQRMLQAAVLHPRFAWDYAKALHPNGRPKFKAPEPIKRAKVKAARKQRRKQK